MNVILNEYMYLWDKPARAASQWPWDLPLVPLPLLVGFSDTHQKEGSISRSRIEIGKKLYDKLLK